MGNFDFLSSQSSPDTADSCRDDVFVIKMGMLKSKEKGKRGPGDKEKTFHLTVRGLAQEKKEL